MTKPSPQEPSGLDAMLIALFQRSKLLCFALIFFCSLGFIDSLNDLADWAFAGTTPSDALLNYGFALLIAASALRAAKAAADKQNHSH